MADITPPTIVITSNKTALKAGDTAVITFTLSEVATDFLLSDLTVSGGTLSNFAGSGMFYSATFLPNANSTSQGSVSVGNFKFSDAAGNANEDGEEANNRLALTIDTILPTIKISLNRTYLNFSETPTISFVLSEPSTNFDVSDISVTGGKISSFSGTGSVYTAVFSPDGTDNCLISIPAYRFTDLVGNANVGSVLTTNSSATSAAISLFPFDPRNASVVWTRLFGTKGFDSGYGLTTGLDDSIYICGFNANSQLASGWGDAYLAKFNSDGINLWTKQFKSGDIAFSITTGIDGSIYVSSNSFLTKFNPDGNIVWTNQFSTNSGANESALTTGVDGFIYICGTTNASIDDQICNGFSDAYISKFKEDGTKLWTRLLGTSRFETGLAVTTGLDGSIYISGSTDGPLDGQSKFGDQDAFVTKYLQDGTKVWTRLIGTSDTDYGQALATGIDGSIFVIGYAGGPLDGKTPYGTFFTKLTPSGEVIWTRMIATYSNGYGLPNTRAITTDREGSIYISGNTQSGIGQSDAFVMKYSSDGEVIWTRFLGTISTDIANGLTVGSDGSIYVGGLTTGDLDGQINSGASDTFLIKLKAPDTSKPSIEIFTKYLSVNSGDAVEISFILSKPSDNFIQSDITTQGGTLSSFQGSGKSYSAVFTPSIEGANGASVSVGSGKFSDALGIFNEDGADANNKVSFTVSVPADNIPPTISVSSNKTNLLSMPVE